jgi:hypothetical protein
MSRAIHTLDSKSHSTHTHPFSLSLPCYKGQPNLIHTHIDRSRQKQKLRRPNNPKLVGKKVFREKPKSYTLDQGQRSHKPYRNPPKFGGGGALGACSSSSCSSFRFRCDLRKRRNPLHVLKRRAYASFALGGSNNNDSDSIIVSSFTLGFGSGEDDDASTEGGNGGGPTNP